MCIFSMLSVHVVITIHDVSIPMNLAGTEECKIKTIELSPWCLFAGNSI